MISQSKPKNKRSFTPEQKEQYKQKKEAEKLEIQNLYEQFLAKKTIQDFIGIIANYKQMPLQDKHAYYTLWSDIDL